MPEMTGPELQKALGKTQNCLPIIFPSAQGDVPIIAQAMKNGAVDFLTKPVDRNALIKAIHPFSIPLISNTYKVLLCLIYLLKNMF